MLWPVHKKKKNCTHKEFEEIIKYTKDEKTGRITSDFIDGCIRRDFLSNSFSYLSIFDDEEGTIKRDKKRVEEILRDPAGALTSGKLTPLEDKAMGTLVGMAIADAMGHRFEFQPVVYDEIVLKDMGNKPGGAFNLQPGQWTDDTSMGLCLADSLLMHDGNLDCHDLMHRFISWYECGYDNAFRYDKSKKDSVGLGGDISLSFGNYMRCPVEQTEAGDKRTSGNGSVMRNAPVPICFHADMDKALEIAERQSYTTHQGTEAAECCRLLTYITVRALNGEDVKTVLNIISEKTNMPDYEEGEEEKEEKKEVEGGGIEEGNNNNNNNNEEEENKEEFKETIDNNSVEKEVKNENGNEGNEKTSENKDNTLNESNVTNNKEGEKNGEQSNNEDSAKNNDDPEIEKAKLDEGKSNDNTEMGIERDEGEKGENHPEENGINNDTDEDNNTKEVVEKKRKETLITI